MPGGQDRGCSQHSWPSLRTEGGPNTQLCDFKENSHLSVPSSPVAFFIIKFGQETLPLTLSGKLNELLWMKCEDHSGLQFLSVQEPLLLPPMPPCHQPPQKSEHPLPPSVGMKHLATVVFLPCDIEVRATPFGDR